MATSRLWDTSIYTIIDPDRLDAASHGRGESEPINEGHWWATGQQMVADARKSGRAVPVIFADATDCTELIAWALLVKVKKKGSGTCYTFRSLQRLPPGHAPQDLFVPSLGRKIAPHFIRPYVICSTPDFLLAEKAASGEPAVPGWVVKGVRSRMDESDWTRCLERGAKVNWSTTKRLHGIQKRAAAFFFKGSPDSLLVGEGRLLGTTRKDGASYLIGIETVREWKTPLAQADLRRDPVLRDAAFLKSGPVGTFYPLTAPQVRRIQELEQKVRGSIDGAAVEWQADASLESAVEGRLTKSVRLHRSRERALRDAKVADVLRRKGRLRCEVPGCRFDFEAVYGELGRGYVEVHHRGALCDRPRPSRTRLDDLAVVCANCHAMIHRGGRCRPLEAVRVRR